MPVHSSPAATSHSTALIRGDPSARKVPSSMMCRSTIHSRASAASSGQSSANASHLMTGTVPPGYDDSGSALVGEPQADLALGAVGRVGRVDQVLAVRQREVA